MSHKLKDTKQRRTECFQFQEIFREEADAKGKFNRGDRLLHTSHVLLWLSKQIETLNSRGLAVKQLKKKKKYTKLLGFLAV